MGLDMYLYKIPMVPERAVVMAGAEGPAAWTPPAKLEFADETEFYGIMGRYIMGSEDENGNYQMGGYERAQEAAYWRKSNQIHGWFVENCQGGEDDCGYYHVPTAKARELLGHVDRILETADEGQLDVGLAQRLLATQSGFFFGSTQYDDWYVQDVRETKEQLEAVLAPGGMGEFDYLYYHSSW